MPARRDTPDGLPFNCYERRGLRDYSIGYKAGKPRRWLIRESCPVDDKIAVAKLKRAVLKRIADMQTSGGSQDGLFRSLSLAWLKAQEDEPVGSEGRRASTTLAENRREILKLNSILGDMPVAELTKTDAYDYLEAGRKKLRPAKANKEIALARTILEYAARKGVIATNPFADIKKNVTAKYDRRVSQAELDLAVEVGRQMGGASHIVALGLRTAWLCLRRSVEVRDFQRHQIGPDGIDWVGAKRKRGTAERSVTIEWSPDLRATVDEALAVKRFEKAPATFYVFGNMMGQKYTKGGWKKMLSNLMAACVAEAAKRELPFEKFSLQDCRPKGVSDKLERGDADTQDATLHTNKKMIDNVYDRRRTRLAKPAG